LSLLYDNTLLIYQNVLQRYVFNFKMILLFFVCSKEI